jgi:hypothetical protein
MTRSLTFLAALTTVAAFALLVPEAQAGSAPAQVSSQTGNLVRGGAPLPEFNLDFPGSGSLRLGRGPAAGGQDLDISVTSADKDLFHFTFSPRPQLGFGLERLSGVTQPFASLTWNLFDSSTVFGSFGIAGTLNRGLVDDPSRRSLGLPLNLHERVELGYHVNGQQSLSLSLDHSRIPDASNERSEPTDNLRLRYGYRF